MSDDPVASVSPKIRVYASRIHDLKIGIPRLSHLSLTTNLPKTSTSYNLQLTVKSYAGNGDLYLLTELRVGMKL